MQNPEAIVAPDGQTPPAAPGPADLLTLTAAALPRLQALVAGGRQALRERVLRGGKLDAGLLETHQYGAHALAWLATYVEALRQLQGWAAGLQGEGRFGEIEALILQIGFGEYLAQIRGGIAMSQGEVARLADLGLADPGLEAAVAGPEVAALLAGNSAAARARLVELMVAADGAATFGASGLGDELEMIRAQFRRFADVEVIPHAQGWHLRDELIPMEVIKKLAEMGVFGLTIPEEYGGFGLAKAAMVVVSEELSRGHIGVGSLGTRSEIAAELILGGGTAEQKASWLPQIASGAVLPTAVFTEPDTGSDLGALRTRAVPDGEGWAVPDEKGLAVADGMGWAMPDGKGLAVPDGKGWTLTGNKTWITHAARATLMIVLARTDPASRDHRGLSLFLAEKLPGADFPVAGLTGSAIGVLGYRGMKEYELAFDGFRVAAGNLLGGVPGQGFRQLMQTFESARIQTAARAIGVAQSALEAGLRYACDRVQFGKALVGFPRVSSKLAMMAVEIMLARQLTYHAARARDAGRRCDLEAGMAKLLAARVAWAAADNAVQIHGGNGFALEYPISRILCDARVLSIFEGTAEIQAQVIARRLLD